MRSVVESSTYIISSQYPSILDITNLFGPVPTPNIPMRNEGEKHVCSSPLCWFVESG